MYGEMSVLDTYNRVAKLSILAQVVQYIARLQNTQTPYQRHYYYRMLQSYVSVMCSNFLLRDNRWRVSPKVCYGRLLSCLFFLGKLL